MFSNDIHIIFKYIVKIPITIYNNVGILTTRSRQLNYLTFTGHKFWT